MAYCTESDVKVAAGRWQALTSDESTAVTAAIAEAQAWVDQQTDQWFESRELIVTTEAWGPNQKRLFTPAPIIELESITEEGTELTFSGDDPEVYNYTKYLEKSVDNAVGFINGAGPFWSTKQQGIVLTGTFGFETTPADIKKVTAHAAAVLLGWVNRSYTTGDGITGAVLDLDILPKWARLIIDARQRGDLDGQVFLIAEAP